MANALEGDGRGEGMMEVCSQVGEAVGGWRRPMQRQRALSGSARLLAAVTFALSLRHDEGLHEIRLGRANLGVDPHIHGPTRARHAVATAGSRCGALSGKEGG